MSDEQWLRDGLADAVPDPPETPGRAASAEARARRTRRRTAAAATVLGTAGVVAVVAVLATTLGSDDRAADPAVPATTGSVAPVDVPDCPPAPEGPEPMDEIDPAAPGPVPDGATAVRLCQGSGTDIDAPEAPLVTDVDGLTTLINDLPEAGEPTMCTNDYGPGYRLVFSYPDGSTFVVSSQQYGCRLNVVGSTYRADADAPWDGFMERLRIQQAEQD